MKKQFIASIGYTDYAIDLEDAVALLAIASRAKAVKQRNYSGPYHALPEHEAFVSELSLAHVAEPEQDEEGVDPFTAATRKAAREEGPF